MKSLPRPILLLQSALHAEITLAEHLKAMYSTSFAVREMIDPSKINLKSLNTKLYTYMRIQTGYCATKYVLPWLTQQGFTSTHLMHASDTNQTNGCLDDLNTYITMMKIDQDFYAKALAYILVINKQISLTDEDLADDPSNVLDKISTLIRFNGFSINHLYKSANFTDFNLAEDQAGMACLILHTLGIDAQYPEVENLYNASALLKKYSNTENSFTLHGITVQLLKGGKTKYTLSKEHGKLLEERVLPHVMNFKNLWA